MVPFKTKSDQNNTSKRTRFHQSFQNFLGEHAPEPPGISVAGITIFVYKSSYFLFRNLSNQNIDQNASIVACFQKFHLDLSTP